MPTFRLMLEYDGSGFEGWQVQPGGRRTVQGVLEAAVAQVTGAAGFRLIGAGRTDAGVHAEGQVAGLSVETALAAERLARALNGVLPPDVAVRACATVPDGFHARYDATGKHYRYAIWNGATRSPLREGRFHWVPSRLDVAAMGEGAAALAGDHDFASFQAAGSDVRSSERCLRRLDVTGEPRGEVWLEVEGPGFLRHMVRILAGTLIDVGLGRTPADQIPAILAARDRSRAGRTAPAQGLTLVRVDYPEAPLPG
ncbi:MAG: tRNA pseudouridine(38-40) synthase TruA [Myxococcota bacterium]